MVELLVQPYTLFFYTLYTLFFNKNPFHKNVEAEFRLKFKNITLAESQLRTIFIPTKCF